jgi:NAD(P)-dependent dehydrogenase (short-subunit alcohol dehydrogenase family)
MRLKDKVVLIGGVGQGMGQAMGLLFAQEGAKVVLVARQNTLIGPMETQIQEMGGKALAIEADMSERADVAHAFEKTIHVFGRLDAFCSVAGGYYKHLKDATEVENEFFDLVLQNHLKSVFYGTRAAVPHLKAAGGGAILTISAAYKTRRDGNVAYGTAKEGVIGLTKNLARELSQHNIRVNCIAPGLVRLPISVNTINPPAPSLDRLGQPEDIAYAAAYLISDESAWLTGQVLTIDGGADVYAGQPFDLR